MSISLLSIMASQKSFENRWQLGYAAQNVCVRLLSQALLLMRSSEHAHDPYTGILTSPQIERSIFDVDDFRHVGDPRGFHGPKNHVWSRPAQCNVGAAYLVCEDMSPANRS